MLYFLKKLISYIIQFFLPYHCIMCLESSNQQRDICYACQRRLPYIQYACRQCGYILHTATLALCGQCIKQPPHFDCTVAAFYYDHPVDLWLKQFKFHKKALYARILTEIYAEKLALIFSDCNNIKPEALIPVPLHWRRLSQRGFNQAHIIAYYLSKKLHIPILKASYVKRIKHTQAQSQLELKKRRHNLDQAFNVQKLPKIVRVAIVDDILTTGSTVNELAKQLKKNGVQHVAIWALARTKF